MYMAVNLGSEADRMSNCAMCTIAAVVGSDTAVIARVLNVDGQSDDHLARGSRVGGEGKAQQQGVLNCMIRLVVRMFAHLGVEVKGLRSDRFLAPGDARGESGAYDSFIVLPFELKD